MGKRSAAFSQSAGAECVAQAVCTPARPLRRRSERRSGVGPGSHTANASGSAAPAWPRRRFELGLVDELRIFRNPVVGGGGTPFLPPVTENVPLDLIETRTVGSRVIYERYGRARA